jgi:hypothetical protein
LYAVIPLNTKIIASPKNDSDLLYSISMAEISVPKMLGSRDNA